MCVRLIFNPSPYLSEGLRYQIMEFGIKLDDYVANIESKLRSQGEFNLVSEMLHELKVAVATRKVS